MSGRAARRWDAVVAGAGPAGAATAALLASAGYRTLLVDRARFPREKPCSDFIAPGARPVLARLGVLARLERRGTRLRGMEITSPSGVTLRGHYAGSDGLGLPRRELDATLVEHAVASGATLWDETRVGALLRRGAAVSGLWVRHHGGAEAVDARVVVGADGLRSMVARALGGTRRVGARRLALVAQLAEVAGLHDVGEIFVGDRRYAGIAPLPGGAANVAVVMPAAAARRGQSAAQLFWNELRRFPAVYERVRERAVLRRVLATGPFGWRSRHPVVDGALLVGDAAQFFDPLTGDGVAHALLGAALAADTIAEALDRMERPTGRALAPYRAARRRRFALRWAVQRALGLAVEHPTLFDFGVRALARREAMGDRIVRFAGGIAARPARGARSAAPGYA